MFTKNRKGGKKKNDFFLNLDEKKYNELNKYFHGSPKPFVGKPVLNRADTNIGKGDMKITANDIFKGFYVTNQKDYALMYARNEEKNITPVIINPDAKVLHIPDIISQEVLSNSLARTNWSSLPKPNKPFPFQKEFNDYVIDEIKQIRKEKGKEPLNDNRIEQIKDTLNPSSKEWDMEGVSKTYLEKFVKDKGFDIVEFGRESIILNPDIAFVGSYKDIQKLKGKQHE